VANLFRTLKFYQNLASFAEDMTKTFRLTFLLGHGIVHDFQVSQGAVETLFRKVEKHYNVLLQIYPQGYEYQ